jgi:actin-related protein 9
LFTYHFGQPPRENTTSLILVPPPTRLFVNSNAVLANYTQIAFEALNCSTFSIMPWPVASLFGVGAMTGMVVHIGTYSTEIGVVVESTVRTDVGGCVNVGKDDCIAHLAELLSKDQEVRKQITENASSSTTVEAIFRELATGILDDEDRSKIMIPLASGQKAAVVGDDGEQEEEEGVLNVAKMLVY